MPRSGKKKKSKVSGRAKKGQRVTPRAGPLASPSFLAGLAEKRLFKPSSAFRRQANVNDAKIYRRAAKQLERFWAAWARQSGRMEEAAAGVSHVLE